MRLLPRYFLRTLVIFVTLVCVLAGGSITEKGVRKLTSLQKLDLLYVDGVPISTATARELKQALPNTELLGIGASDFR